MKTITELEFKEKINSTLVVQFSAEWCGPCKTLSTTIDQCSDTLNNQIFKMDIDSYPQLSSVLRIRSVPTLVRFENGTEVKRLIGNQDISTLQDFTS